MSRVGQERSINEALGAVYADPGQYQEAVRFLAVCAVAAERTIGARETSTDVTDVPQEYSTSALFTVARASLHGACGDFIQRARTLEHPIDTATGLAHLAGALGLAEIAIGLGGVRQNDTPISDRERFGNSMENVREGLNSANVATVGQFTGVLALSARSRRYGRTSVARHNLRSVGGGLVFYDALADFASQVVRYPEGGAKDTEQPSMGAAWDEIKRYGSRSDRRIAAMAAAAMEGYNGHGLDDTVWTARALGYAVLGARLSAPEHRLTRSILDTLHSIRFPS
jgi:hypothetical protein